MGKRTTGRRLAIQILYQMDLCRASLDDACDAAFSNVDYIEQTRDFSVELASRIWEVKDQLDVMIEEKSKEWKLERINPIDRNILRLGIYELLHAPEKLPPGVIIDEAVELAKKFSDPESSKFINGILGNIN